MHIGSSYLWYVHTADQINSIVLIAQIARPSSTELDQLLVSDRYSTMHDLHTTSHDSSTTSTQQPTRSLLDHPNHYTNRTRCLLDILDQLDLYSTLTRSLVDLRVGYKNLWSFWRHSVDLRSTRVMEVEQLQLWAKWLYSSRETGSWLWWSLKRKKKPRNVEDAEEDVGDADCWHPFLPFFTFWGVTAGDEDCPPAGLAFRLFHGVLVVVYTIAIQCTQRVPRRMWVLATAACPYKGSCRGRVRGCMVE